MGQNGPKKQATQPNTMHRHSTHISFRSTLDKGPLRTTNRPTTTDTHTLCGVTEAVWSEITVTNGEKMHKFSISPQSPLPDRCSLFDLKYYFVLYTIYNVMDL